MEWCAVLRCTGSVLTVCSSEEPDQGSGVPTGSMCNFALKPIISSCIFGVRAGRLGLRLCESVLNVQRSTSPSIVLNLYLSTSEGRACIQACTVLRRDRIGCALSQGLRCIPRGCRLFQSEQPTNARLHAATFGITECLSCQNPSPERS